MKKDCSKCKNLKPLREFYQDRRTPGGFYSACKRCHLIATERWHKNNFEKRRKINREHQKERRKNFKHKLDGNTATSICLALKGQKAGRKWETLVGYTLQNLINHLESQFTFKMCWANYGSYWEVDHIKPRISFNYKYSEDLEFQQCWALNNLQPLEKTKNRAKHSNL